MQTHNKLEQFLIDNQEFEETVAPTDKKLIEEKKEKEKKIAETKKKKKEVNEKQ